MAKSAQELTALTQQLFQDPQVQQLMQQWQQHHAQTGVWSDRRGPSTFETAIFQKMKQLGIEDVRIDFSGPDGSPMLKNRGIEGWQWPLIVGGAAMGGGALAGAFGGASAAGAGASAAGGSMPAAGVAPFAGLPGGIGAGVGSAGWGAGAAAGGGGILDTILKVAPVGAGLVNHFASGDGAGGPGGQAGQMPPELSELLKLSMDRMRQQEPLFQAVTKQALAGLPSYAQGK